MKFLMVFFLAFSAFADEVQVCQKQVKDTLVPSVTFNEKSDSFEFVKDEKKALEMLHKYNPTKLALQSHSENGKREMSDCKFILDPKFKQSYCENIFENLNFLRGLNFGLKNYAWKDSTKNLGKEKIISYLKELSKREGPLLHTVIGYEVLEDLVTDFPQKSVDSAEIKKLRLALESEQKKLQAKSTTAPAKTCQDIQSSMKEEFAVAETYREKLSTFVNKL
jgi:hypothetical protein